MHTHLCLHLLWRAYLVTVVRYHSRTVTWMDSTVVFQLWTTDWFLQLNISLWVFEAWSIFNNLVLFSHLLWRNLFFFLFSLSLDILFFLRAGWFFLFLLRTLLFQWALITLFFLRLIFRESKPFEEINSLRIIHSQALQLILCSILHLSQILLHKSFKIGQGLLKIRESVSPLQS